IQFLGGMPEVHEELFHAFNELHTAEKQIVLASDRPPKVIPNLDERLVSRFEAGLVAGMEPPDLATRVAILEHRAKDASATIDPRKRTADSPRSSRVAAEGSSSRARIRNASARRTTSPRRRSSG